MLKWLYKLVKGGTMSPFQPITNKEADITVNTLSKKVFSDLYNSAWAKQYNPLTMTRLEFLVWEKSYELGMLYTDEEIKEMIEHFNIKD